MAAASVADNRAPAAAVRYSLAALSPIIIVGVRQITASSVPIADAVRPVISPCVSHSRTTAISVIATPNMTNGGDDDDRERTTRSAPATDPSNRPRAPI